MSLFLFLIPAAIGGALIGFYGNFDEEELEDYIGKDAKRYGTMMNDENILKEALHDYGITYAQDEVLKTSLDEGKVLFLRNKEGNYDIIFEEGFSDEFMKLFADDIFEYYKRIVQERTYRKVMEYIKNQELDYEERITDESDVVLTLTIN